jgi:hypothetical protein
VPSKYEREWTALSLGSTSPGSTLGPLHSLPKSYFVFATFHTPYTLAAYPYYVLSSAMVRQSP